MPYELPIDQDAADTAKGVEFAKDFAAIATQYNASLSSNYDAMYRNAWRIGRSDWSTAQINIGLKILDGVGLRIMADAGIHIAGLKQLLGDEIPNRLLIPPRPYVLKEITFADGHVVSELATFLEYFQLAMVHGHAIAGYVEVGELLPEWQ